MSREDFRDDEADQWHADVIATPGGGCGGRDITGPRVTTFGEALETLMANLERGEPPVEWTPSDRPWASLAFRPGEIHVLGGPPAEGKTSLALNVLDRMLVRYSDLRVLIASNEMSTATMNERLISMRSGIPYRAIRRRDEHAYTAADLDRLKAEWAAMSSRLAFVERPFTIEQVRDVAADFNAGIVFVDYLQGTGMSDGSRDAQQRIAATMRALRALADTGPCVITTAAMSRSGIARAQDRVGKTDVNALDMGVFLHGSEIEHEVNVGHLLLAEPGAKVAMGTDEEGEPIRMWLQCVKARDLVKAMAPLLFDGRTQKFTLRDIAPSAAKPDTKGRRTSKGGKNETNRGKSGDKGYPADGGTMWLS